MPWYTACKCMSSFSWHVWSNTHLFYIWSAESQSQQGTGLEISQNKICGWECDRCKFELNKNILLFSIDQAISGKNVCMCYESHAQWGSACAASVLLQSSSYIILHSRCAMNSTPKEL